VAEGQAQPAAKDEGPRLIPLDDTILHKDKPTSSYYVTLADKLLKRPKSKQAISESALRDPLLLYSASLGLANPVNTRLPPRTNSERLFTLMADAGSRDNLRANHPEEYRQAQNDPAIQSALRKYKPEESKLTEARKALGGEIIDDDYLRRVYDKYTSGINKRDTGGKGLTAYDRVIRPQRADKYSREAEAEYHYQNGLHEFGPAFGSRENVCLPKGDTSPEVLFTHVQKLINKGKDYGKQESDRNQASARRVRGVSRHDPRLLQNNRPA